MKSTFKIGNIELEGMKLENVEFTQEYTAQDAINLAFAGKSFVKGLLKEIPEMLGDLEVCSNTFNEIDERVTEGQLAKVAKKKATSAMDIALKALAKAGINPSYIKIETKETSSSYDEHDTVRACREEF